MAYVKMDVDCISPEICLSCGMLDIEITSEMLTFGLTQCNVNHLYCKNKYRCEKMYENIKKALKNEYD